MIRVIGTEKDGTPHHLLVKHGTEESIREHLNKIGFNIVELKEESEEFAEHD